MTLDYQNIALILGIGGTIFGVYSYFKDPQIKLETNDTVFAVEMRNLKGELANLRDNHVHTLEVKLDITNKSIFDMAIQMTRLQTTLEERLPKKS